jgi:membrane associated rhomboid family serine protease
VIIPLGSTRPLSRPTLATFILVGVNLLVFGIDMALHNRLVDPAEADAVLRRFVLEPDNPKPWTFVTYAFLHGGFMHLLGNMLFLFVFGPNVEDRFGRTGFLLFYLGGGAVAGGLHFLFERHPVIGASGAVAAVTGAYLVLFPRTSIKVLFLLFVIGIFEIPAWWFIAGQVVMDLWLQGTGRSGNVATLAHLGGYGFGIGLSMLLLATGILKREQFDLFSISRHASRRRQFREVAREQMRVAAKRAAAAAAARARSEVTEAMMAGDLPAAGAAYRRLLETHGTGAAMLSRTSQYTMANSLFSAGDHQTAATAYMIFMTGYPKDPEIPTVRLMLGLINARYLNDPVKAKAEIREAIGGLPEGDYKQLARELLAELG